MNTCYLSILRVNMVRFFRNPVTSLLYAFFFVWGLSFFDLCISGKWPVFSIYVVCSCLFLFNMIFWTAWIEGKKDPFIEINTEDKIRDSYFITFMSCLPIDRKRLYSVQVLFCVVLAAAICIISFVIQIMFPQARSNLSYIIYMHFLMFTLWIMAGGLCSVLSFPLFFRFNRKKVKDIAVSASFTGIVLCVLVCVILFAKEKIVQLIQIESFFYIADRPFVLLIPMLAGMLLFWLGSIIFKSIDIR